MAALPARMADAVLGKGAVADLQGDDILAGGLEFPGDGEDVEGGLGGEAAGEGRERN